MVVLLRRCRTASLILAVDLFALGRPSDQVEPRLRIARSFGNALPAYVIEGRYRNNFAQLSPNRRARGTGTPEMCKVCYTGPPSATGTFTIFGPQHHFEASTLTVMYLIDVMTCICSERESYTTTKNMSSARSTTM
jgi:hypothetical protein